MAKRIQKSERKESLVDIICRTQGVGRPIAQTLEAKLSEANKAKIIEVVEEGKKSGKPYGDAVLFLLSNPAPKEEQPGVTDTPANDAPGTDTEPVPDPD